MNRHKLLAAFLLLAGSLHATPQDSVFRIETARLKEQLQWVNPSAIRGYLNDIKKDLMPG